MDEAISYDSVSVTSTESDTSEFESLSGQSKTNTVTTDVEIDVTTFKENDNDQNNNIDDLPLKYNNSKRITEDTVAKDIEKETRQICSLLPRFTYDYVHKKLHRVRYAQNRVEICLWNLLPIDVPKAKWFPKFNNGNSTQRTMEMSNSPKENTIRNYISNNSPNIINAENLLNNYLTYFQFMQGNKRGKLAGNAKYFDISERNDIRSNFLTSQWVNGKKNIFESVHKDPEPKILDVDANFESFNASTTITEINATSIQKNVPPTRTTIETTLDNTGLNNFSAQEVIAGTKKKEITIASAPDEKICKRYSERGYIEPALSMINEIHMQEKEQENDNDTNEHFIYLSSAFPNADPQFLNRVVSRANGSDNEIANFIESQCDNPTYPTKGEKLKKTEITNQQKQYTTEFDVKHFLEIFPNPFLHFENPRRNCTYHCDALQFLQYHFNRLDVDTLSWIYEKHNYHLTLAAQELAVMLPDRESNHNRTTWERNPTEHIPLLQECAFIQHKNEIRKYLDKLMEEDEREFKKLKERKEFLECLCCCNEECMPSKCSTCDNGHVFCNECIAKGVQLTIAQGKTRISCFVDTKDEFCLSTLQTILPPSQFSILIRNRQEKEVKAAGLEGLVSCPFCHFSSIPPEGDKVFKCFNPECMKESCRLCKELNHVPLKCNEKSEKARLFLQEKMTEAVVRKCCNCDRPYVKEYGCNKITCPCGAIMCYLCNAQIKGYDHFNSSGSCPLHSDDKFIDSNTVQKVAKETVAYLKSKDPNVKIDTTGLLNEHLSSDVNHPLVSTRLKNRLRLRQFDDF